MPVRNKIRNQISTIWADNKYFFLTAGLLFFGGMLLGFYQAETLKVLADQLFGQLEEVVERIRENGGGTAATFWAIYSNNVLSALMMMAMGLFFGLFPIIGMVTNGLLVGYIFATYSANGINPWLVFAAGILPHGIFELTAIFLAAGFGLRLGSLTLRSIGLLFQPGKAGIVKNAWYDTLKQFPAAVLLVVVMLFVAGVVESTITPAILHGLLGDQIQQIQLMR
ncbi:stage II sporulation protein M [Brevibacillus sp. TJ4]|uniref:stage II sporulation protein M n=1 Tax=Brevibacillus sp. TJ4 TaxID=3234853 RepID=UPI0037D7FD65